MRVNNIQLVEVVYIRFGAKRTGGVRAGIRKIIHATILRIAVDGLVLKPGSHKSTLGIVLCFEITLDI